MSDAEYDALKARLAGSSIFVQEDAPTCTVGQPGQRGQKSGEASLDYAKMGAIYVVPGLAVSLAEEDLEVWSWRVWHGRVGRGSLAPLLELRQAGCQLCVAAVPSAGAHVWGWRRQLAPWFCGLGAVRLRGRYALRTVRDQHN